MEQSPQLYLANHQTFVESIIVNTVLATIGHRPLTVLGKEQHRNHLLGKFERTCTTYPGVETPQAILYVNREDPQDIIRSMNDLREILTKENRSVLVHVEGIRSYQAADKIDKLSSMWADMCVQTGIPIVPVRFLGGLPRQNPEKVKYNFPIGYGKQDIYVGEPIASQDLAHMPYAERARYIRDSINGLGADVENEVTAPNPAFEQAVISHQEEFQCDEVGSTIYQALKSYLEAPHLRLQERTQEVNGLLASLIYAGELAKQSKQSVELIVPASDQGQWLHNLATWFYGEKGPRLAMGVPSHSGAHYHVVTTMD